MKLITLDANQMGTPEQTQKYLKEVLHFPSYYGENLDALYDCLGEITEETTVRIPKHLSHADALADYGNTLLQVFTQAAAENKKLTVELI
jgi:ribonuclease inhibitor